jgi:outer membrane protein OmpA-like peptidoglycan-associated protein
MFKFQFIVFGLVSLWICNLSEAQPTWINERSTVCDVFYGLNSDNVPEICKKDLSNARGAIIKKKPGKHSNGAIAALIHFAYNSYELAPESKMTLDIIALALKHEFYVKKTFSVNGHTDSVGGDEYNNVLSYKRASAVKRYLVRQGIAAKRLPVVAHGESQLYDPSHPTADVNRRVEFINMNP